MSATFNFCHYCGKRIAPKDTRYTLDRKPYGKNCCQDEEEAAQGFQRGRVA